MTTIPFDIILLIGTFFTVGTYFLLERHIVRVLIGFLLLSHAGNLFLLSVSGSPFGKLAPLVPSGEKDFSNYVDPLPQALILTAIVISMGITIYLLFYSYRLSIEYKTLDLVVMSEAALDDSSSKKEELR